MNDDEIKGAGKHGLGKVKDAAGGLTGDGNLQADGKVDQLSGKVQTQFGKAASVVKDGAEAVSDKVSDLTGNAGDTIARASETVREGASEKGSQASRFSQQAGHFVEQTIQRQPGLSLIGIAAIGYAIAFLVYSPTRPFAPRPPHYRRWTEG